MVDNQHRQIKGYRELDEREISLMNQIKAMGAHLEALVEMCERNGDARWASIGKTHLQQGLMALTRSIAKPGFF